MKPITTWKSSRGASRYGASSWPFGPVPAAPVLALGATGAVPPSMGGVEGGR